MILIAKYLIPKGYSAIAVFPFIILKSAPLKDDVVFVNHEKIHLKQQLELFVVPFYLVYGLEFLFRLAQYRNRYLAYRNISFEREAYCNEFDLKYLNRRPFWSFLKYLRRHEFRVRQKY